MEWRLSSRTSSCNPQPGFTPLAQFSYLQLLDVLTTLAFLTTGGHEANPVVRFAMGAARSPLVGLLALKVCAVAAAVYCTMTARERTLKRINVLFAALVVWNLIALLAT
jgi:Domain of unknown function (DUF5658)